MTTSASVGTLPTGVSSTTIPQQEENTSKSKYFGYYPIGLEVAQSAFKCFDNAVAKYTVGSLMALAGLVADVVKDAIFTIANAFKLIANTVLWIKHSVSTQEEPVVPSEPEPVDPVTIDPVVTQEPKKSIFSRLAFWRSAETPKA